MRVAKYEWLLRVRPRKQPVAPFAVSGFPFLQEVSPTSQIDARSMHRRTAHSLQFRVAGGGPGFAIRSHLSFQADQPASSLLRVALHPPKFARSTRAAVSEGSVSRANLRLSRTARGRCMPEARRPKDTASPHRDVPEPESSPSHVRAGGLHLNVYLEAQTNSLSFERCRAGNKEVVARESHATVARRIFAADSGVVTVSCRSIQINAGLEDGT